MILVTDEHSFLSSAMAAAHTRCWTAFNCQTLRGRAFHPAVLAIAVLWANSGTGAVAGTVIDPAVKAIAAASVLGSITQNVALDGAAPADDNMQCNGDDASNLTNTPQFGNPNTTLSYADTTPLDPSAGTAFGKITSTVANPRMIQFAAKYQF